MGVMSRLPSIRGEKLKFGLEAQHADDGGGPERLNRARGPDVFEHEARAKKRHADVEPEPEIDAGGDGRTKRDARGQREPPRRSAARHGDARAAGLHGAELTADTRRHGSAREGD